MGVGYYEAITQWSKGEYVGATQTQDDFAVMQTNGARALTDDHPESSPRPLTTSATKDRDHLHPQRCRRLLDHGQPADDHHGQRGTGTTSPNLDITLTLAGPASISSLTRRPDPRPADIATGLGASISTTLAARLLHGARRWGRCR